jgi:hypothetical protein
MDDVDLIYSFLVNNEKLEKLELSMRSFNPFKVLNIASHEIRHSNVLAWLLDPHGNHNLGDQLLKKIILKVISDSANQEVVPENITIKEIHFASFFDAKILREDNNIDLLVVSEANKFILLIENKIYSKESGDQLKRYLSIVEKKYKSFKILPVFLTINGEVPKKEKYCILDHRFIYDALQSTLDMYKDRIPNDVINFIQYYTEILRDILVMDDTTKQLCRELYREHKDSIDLIYSVGNELDISIAKDDFAGKIGGEIIITEASPKWFMFALPAFRQIPKMSHDWGQGYPISFWFSDYYGSLKLVLEIGPFDIPEQRVNFLSCLEKNGISIRPSAKQPGRQYTRICTDTETIKDWHDKDEILEKMLKLYKKKKMVEVRDKLLIAIDEFDWNK